MRSSARTACEQCLGTGRGVRPRTTDAAPEFAPRHGAPRRHRTRGTPMRPPSRTESFTDWEATTQGLRWYVCWRLFSRSAHVRCPSTSCWESRPRRSAWAKTASRALLPPWGKWTWRWWANRRGCRPRQANGDWSSWIGTAHGRSGHAARGEGVNALYIALDDIGAGCALSASDGNRNC